VKFRKKWFLQTGFILIWDTNKEEILMDFPTVNWEIGLKIFDLT
jgi:hypothetical protein